MIQKEKSVFPVGRKLLLSFKSYHLYARTYKSVEDRDSIWYVVLFDYV